MGVGVRRLWALGVIDLRWGRYWRERSVRA